ncbi:hypothetical protein NDU88_005375, partial [Pleurodeles waltl]
TCLEAGESTQGVFSKRTLRTAHQNFPHIDSGRQNLPHHCTDLRLLVWKLTYPF